MSCFIVGNETISHVVDCISTDAESRTDLGRRLLYINLNAFRWRYEGRHLEDCPDPALYRYTLNPCNKAQSLMSCECYLYQCAEGGELDEDERVLFARVEAAASLLEGLQGSPDHKAAMWG